MALQLSSTADRTIRWDGGAPSESDVGAVLLAVEEPSVGRMLNGLFHRTGVNAYWAGDLFSCMESLRESPADVASIFVDCHLSTLDMIDFSVSARGWKADVQILLAGGDDAKAAVAALAGDPARTIHVPKPYLPTELAWLLRGPRQPRR